MNYGGLILAAAGLFSIVCAAINFDWFMENRKARIWVKLMGRNGARIFYAALGAAIVALGSLVFVGAIG